MNIDILTDVLTDNNNTTDISKISFLDFIKMTIESVEKLNGKKGAEKQLIVISVIEDFIKDNESVLASELRELINSNIIAHIIDTFVFSSKTTIDINKPPKKTHRCFFC
jgi:hypothetical protein